MGKIKERIGQIAIETIDKMSSRIRFVQGTVKEIDKVERELSLFTPEGAEIGQIMLQSMSNRESSFVLYPKIGSDCIILFEEESMSGCVIATEEVERMELVIGETRVEVTEDGIVLNGGGLGGLVKVEALTARLNGIEESINELKAALSGWVPAPQDGGAALKGAISSWASETLVLTERGDYENEKVKQ